MITIEYIKDGEAVSDFNIEDWIDEIIEYKEKYNINNSLFKISTGLCIDAIRVAIKEKKIDFNSIQFKYNDMILKPNQNGRLPKWPEGFHDKMENYLRQL